MTSTFYPVCLATLVLLSPSPLLAQIGNGNGGNNGGNQNAAGIEINPQGVVSTTVPHREATTVLEARKREYLEEKLPAGLVESTEQRVLSLREVEQQVARALAAGEEVPLAVQALGGLMRVDEVIVDVAGRDVLLVGPAEGFVPDSQGRLLGVESDRPPLLLDDLVVALRSVMSGEETIGCSIDPSNENMARLQQYLRQNSSPTTSSGAAQRYKVMSQILGQQDISIWGVPRNTHFSTILVEADLRMKRISLGIEPAGVKGIRSHLSLLAPQGNSLQRWWFVPRYEPLQTNADRTMFRLAGPRVQLLAQEEFSNAGGQRFDSAQTRESTEKFAMLFSNHYDKLAAKQPAFAELQNLFDLAVVAALIRTEGWQQRLNWPMETFLTSSQLPLGRYPEPRTVSSVATTRKVGRVMLGLVGGVTMDVNPVVRQSRVDPGVPARPPIPPRTSEWLFWNAATTD